jgi:hypothetical protein
MIVIGSSLRIFVLNATRSCTRYFRKNARASDLTVAPAELGKNFA